jgi:hypothetical protein
MIKAADGWLWRVPPPELSPAPSHRGDGKLGPLFGVLVDLAPRS